VYSGFVVRYGPDGAYGWQEVLDFGHQGEIDGVAVDATGNVILVGQFGLPLNLPGSTTPLTPPMSGTGQFVFKQSSSRAFVWSKSYGPVLGGRQFGIGVVNYNPTGIALAPHASAIVFGSVSTPLTLGWVPLSPSGNDAFVAELSP
jgi:hypothetical protein